PCGGKTSSVSILSDLFESLGWRVYRVPETATILFGGGVHFPDLDREASYSFQKSILTVMIQIENTYRELAKLNSKRGIKTVLICDRGAMDPSGIFFYSELLAYMDRNEWLRMLHELQLDEVALRDHRYDCVVHLVTAAKGAEAFYSLENNATRTEGLELAASLDTAVMNAWVGHASLQVIDNVSVKNFTEKCDRVVQAVSTRLGLTSDQNRYGKQVKKHKFLVNNYKFSKDFPVPYRDFHVEQVGMTSVHLNMTIRYPEHDGQRVEIRRNISPREFESLRSQSDPTRKTITKLRRCFLYNDRYFQLDLFQAPQEGLVMLEAYLDYEGNSNRLLVPDWLDCTEITDQNQYSMFSLASR
ncbi:hypothetical protein HDV02_003903, partial [Globomyces sp. JEL0801]